MSHYRLQIFKELFYLVETHWWSWTFTVWCQFLPGVISSCKVIYTTWQVISFIIQHPTLIPDAQGHLDLLRERLFRVLLKYPHTQCSLVISYLKLQLLHVPCNGHNFFEWLKYLLCMYDIWNSIKATNSNLEMKMNKPETTISYYVRWIKNNFVLFPIMVKIILNYTCLEQALFDKPYFKIIFWTYNLKIFSDNNSWNTRDPIDIFPSPVDFFYNGCRGKYG